MRAWLTDIGSELTAPTGWLLVGKVVAGGLAALGAYVSVQSLTQSQRAEQAARFREHMAEIQAGLVSESGMARLGAIRNLEAFALETARSKVSEDDLRQQIQRFPREALLRSMERRKTGYSDGIELSGAAKAADKAERISMMEALDHIGWLGWFASNPQADQPRADHPKFDFRWVPRESLRSGRREAALADVFQRFDFSDLEISDVKFHCNDMHDSNWKFANLRLVKFTHGNLEQSDFSNSNLQFVGFQGASVPSANFDSATLDSVSLDSASHTPDDFCRPAGGGRSANHATNATKATFRGARVYNSSFEGTDFTGASLAGATFSGLVSFSNSKAIGANFSKAVFGGNVDFSEADLTGADFEGATFTNTRFTGAVLRQANFLRSRITDDRTVELLLGAAKLSGANFAEVQGLPADTLCRLIGKGGVVVTDVSAWNRAGRPYFGFWNFQTRYDPAWLQKCANAQ